MLLDRTMTQSTDPQKLLRVLVLFEPISSFIFIPFILGQIDSLLGLDLHPYLFN